VVLRKTVLLFLDDAHGLRGDIGGLLESVRSPALLVLSYP